MLFLLLLTTRSYGKKDKTDIKGLFVNMGGGGFCMENQAFHNWLKLNYQQNAHTIQPAFFMDIFYFNGRHDGGLSVLGSWAKFNNMALSLYYGKTLINHSEHFLSFLNAEVTLVEYGVDGIVTPDYTPPPSLDKSKITLRTNNVAFGLCSKNLILPGKHDLPAFVAGIQLNIEAGYMPWSNRWQDGYYVGSGKAQSFSGTDIHTAPKLNNFLMAVAVSFSIGTYGLNLGK